MLISNFFNLIPIDQFIQPAKEQIVEQGRDITEALVKRYVVVLEKEEVPEEHKDIKIEKVVITNVIKALDLLKLYKIQQVNGNKHNLVALDKVSRLVY